MALWKPFRGSRTDLDSAPKHDGYVYFCDDGSLHFDYVDKDGNLQRKQINADTLTGSLDSTQVTHGERLLSDIINMYLLNIDYDILAFDTTEIVINSTTDNTVGILGQAILGQFILA